MRFRLPKSRQAPRLHSRSFHQSIRWRLHSAPKDNTVYKRATSLSSLDRLLQESKSLDKLGPELRIKEVRIAVLGGGISGLATAYFLTKKFPNIFVTLYESTDRLGGWLQSKRIEVGGEDVTFEQGPRTLRTANGAGLLTLKMLTDLGLLDELVAMPKTSPAALNRFVFYPDRLVRMPHPGLGIAKGLAWPVLTSPLFDGLFSGALHDFRTPPRPAYIQDQSITDWFTRRFGSAKLAQNLASALLHGIYAGDVHKLSMKSIFPALWEMDSQGSLVKTIWASARRKAATLPEGSFRGQEEAFKQKMIKQLPSDLVHLANNTSVYSFKGGITTLSKALEKVLRANPRVDIQLGAKLKSVVYRSADDCVTIESITSDTHTKSTYLQTVSTISAPMLARLVPTATVLSSLTATHAVTVMVVNLYFRSPPSKLLPSPGFGYLLPYSISRAQNPEFALGVIFDSYATPIPDHVDRANKESGTRLTVMLGGHWWDSFSPSQYPSAEDGLAMARSVLARHIGIVEAPEQWHASLNRDCIPQPWVGHWERMRQGGEDLRKGFRGRLSVLGPWYKGVGVNDCVRSAWEVVEALAEPGEAEGVTGLETFERLM